MISAMSSSWYQFPYQHLTFSTLQHRDDQCEHIPTRHVLAWEISCVSGDISYSPKFGSILYHPVARNVKEICWFLIAFPSQDMSGNFIFLAHFGMAMKFVVLACSKFEIFFSQKFGSILYHPVVGSIKEISCGFPVTRHLRIVHISGTLNLKFSLVKNLDLYYTAL